VINGTTRSTGLDYFSCIHVTSLSQCHTPGRARAVGTLRPTDLRQRASLAAEQMAKEASAFRSVLRCPGLQPG